MSGRIAARSRNTKETQIAIDLDIDGEGRSNVSTGVPFFDHMLNQLSKHGGFDMEVQATGDLEIDTHHTVEDTGILLGEVFRTALGRKVGVRRFASISVPLDEARVEVTVDLSGRPYFSYDVDLPYGAPLGTPAFDAQLAEEFWRGFVMSAGITLHIRMVTGKNIHHIIEASFKGVARALKDAVRVEGKGIPSTKGTLDADDQAENDVKRDGLIVLNDPSEGSVRGLSRVELVAFDFNGTLLADVDNYVSTNVELALHLGLHGLTGERYRRLAGMPGQDWTYAFRVIAREEENDYVLGLPTDSLIGAATGGTTMESLYQEIHEQRMTEQWSRWERRPEQILSFGARKTIEQLLDKNIPVAMISTQYNKQIEPVLELAGILGMIGRENIFGGIESKAEAMRHIAANADIKPCELLYVGDERKDLAHAADAGAQFAHVSNGVNSRVRVANDARQLRQRIALLDGVNQVGTSVASINEAVKLGRPVDMSEVCTSIAS